MIYLFCDLCYHYKAVRVCRVMCHHPSKTWQGHFKSCLQVFLRSKYHAEAQRHRKTPANEPLAWLIGVHDILTFLHFTIHIFVFIIGNYGFQSLPQFLGLLLFLQVAVEGERCWIWIKLKDHIYPPLFNICLNYLNKTSKIRVESTHALSRLYISWYHDITPSSHVSPRGELAHPLSQTWQKKMEKPGVGPVWCLIWHELREDDWGLKGILGCMVFKVCHQAHGK